LDRSDLVDDQNRREHAEHAIGFRGYGAGGHGAGRFPARVERLLVVFAV
jgi:hypothetical protein